MSGPFATATEFCEFTGMSFPADPARLQALLESASALVRNFCGQELSQVSNDVQTFLPVDTDTLWLAERPVTSVSSVLEGTIPVTTYAFDSSRIVRNSGATWPLGAVVTYSHGFAETAEGFKDLRRIVIQSAARAFTLNERSASEAMGSTLMESAGYAPEVFLTQGERNDLGNFVEVGVG